MDFYLSALLEYFKLYRIGENWLSAMDQESRLTVMDHILRWVQFDNTNGSVWIEVKHQVVDSDTLFVHLATNNLNQAVRLRTLANKLPATFLKHQKGMPETSEEWARVGYYMNNPKETNEWFALISHVVNFLAIKNLKEK